MSSEHKQPFLKYTDTDSNSDCESQYQSRPHNSRPSPPPRTTSPNEKPSYLTILERAYPKVISYGTIFVLTSAFWMVVVFIFVPSPTSISTSSYRPSASSGSGGGSGTQASGKASPYSSYNITTGTTLLECGEKDGERSNEEARRMGCRYDVLLNAWVPGPCFDEECVVPVFLSHFPFRQLTKSPPNTDS